MGHIRQEALVKLYPNQNLDHKFILWVDSKTLFPYAFESVKARVRLNSDVISYDTENKEFIGNNKILVKQENDYYYAGTTETNGFPFIFNTSEEIKKIKQIVVSFEFVYQTYYGRKNKFVICASQNVNILDDRNASRDYIVTVESTVIPNLLEKVCEKERKAIIDTYDNIIELIKSNSSWSLNEIRIEDPNFKNVEKELKNSLLTQFESKKYASISIHLLKNEEEIDILPEEELNLGSLFLNLREEEPEIDELESLAELF